MEKKKLSSHGADAHRTGGVGESIAQPLLHGGDAFSTGGGGSLGREGSHASRELFWGRYEMLEKIGYGGMAEVWRVYDHQRKQDVALKRMSTHLQESEEAQRRFFREIALLQGLKHPHITAIYESSPEGFFFTMELLRGQDLRQFLLERKRLPLHLALSIFGQVGQALLAAHQAGVVHRDLKPENIFLLDEPPSFVKLLDFGIAVALEGTRMTTTQKGQLGTAYYMAPEQLHGEHRDIGVAADVYSCGVLLYELLTGRIPQIGAPPIHKHIERLEEKGQLGSDEFPPALRDAYYNHLIELEKAYQRAIPSEPEDRCSLQELVSFVESISSAWTQQRKNIAEEQMMQILVLLEQGGEFQVFESLLPESLAIFPEQKEVSQVYETIWQARRERDALEEQGVVEEEQRAIDWEDVIIKIRCPEFFSGDSKDDGEKLSFLKKKRAMCRRMMENLNLYQYKMDEALLSWMALQEKGYFSFQEREIWAAHEINLLALGKIQRSLRFGCWIFFLFSTVLSFYAMSFVIDMAKYDWVPFVIGLIDYTLLLYAAHKIFLAFIDELRQHYAVVLHYPTSSVNIFEGFTLVSTEEISKERLQEIKKSIS